MQARFSHPFISLIIRHMLGLHLSSIPREHHANTHTHTFSPPTQNSMQNGNHCINCNLRFYVYVLQWCLLHWHIRNSVWNSFFYKIIIHWFMFCFIYGTSTYIKVNKKSMVSETTRFSPKIHLNQFCIDAWILWWIPSQSFTIDPNPNINIE